MFFKAFVTLLLISILNAKFPDDPEPYYHQGKPAIGFQYDQGPMWAVICHNTFLGDTPGKSNGRDGAHFSYAEQEHGCTEYTVIYGKLVHSSADPREKCEASVFNQKENYFYYNALIPSKHGMVPGKSNMTFDWAFYGWGGKEYSVNSDFYVIC